MYVLYLNNGNNRRRNDGSLRDWHHNDKTDLRLYWYVYVHVCDKNVSVLYVVLNPFEENQICVGLHFHWRSNYQDRGLRINPISRYSPATFWCLSKAYTLICNVMIYHGLFVFGRLRWEVIARFVDIGDNCWPSLFKLSFHKLLDIICSH